WGVTAVTVPWFADTDALLTGFRDPVRRTGLVPDGAPVVVTGGWPFAGPAPTNLVHVAVLGSPSGGPAATAAQPECSDGDPCPDQEHLARIREQVVGVVLDMRERAHDREHDAVLGERLTRLLASDPPERRPHPRDGRTRRGCRSRAQGLGIPLW